MPPAGIALIDGDDSSVYFVEIAIRARHGDGELGNAITAIPLDMYFNDFNHVASCARGKALDIIGSESFPATYNRARR